jgi:Glycosyl transferase family 2
MNLVMTLLVRNEQDILATNIDFHLAQGVDFFIITDNLSRDSTPAIIEKYVKGGRAFLIKEDTDDYSQGIWVTRMARMACADFHADWVINNDADEFWWPTQGRNLKEALSIVPDHFDAARVQRSNFLPSQACVSSEFWRNMTIRESNSLNALGQPLPAKVCHRAFPDIEIMQGNHGSLRAGLPMSATDAPIQILHFPLRSFQQFNDKIAFGGAAYARNTTLHPQVGQTWRTLYRKYLSGELRSYYDEQVRDDSVLAVGLASGRLQRDYRLRDFMQELCSGRAQRSAT